MTEIATRDIPLNCEVFVTPGIPTITSDLPPGTKQLEVTSLGRRFLASMCSFLLMAVTRMGSPLVSTLAEIRLIHGVPAHLKVLLLNSWPGPTYDGAFTFRKNWCGRSFWLLVRVLQDRYRKIKCELNLQSVGFCCTRFRPLQPPFRLQPKRSIRPPKYGRDSISCCTIGCGSASRLCPGF